MEHTRCMWCCSTLLIIMLTINKLNASPLQPREVQITRFEYEMIDPCSLSTKPIKDDFCKWVYHYEIIPPIIRMCHQAKQNPIAGKQKRSIIGAGLLGTAVAIAALSFGKSSSSQTYTGEELLKGSNLELSWNERVNLSMNQFQKLAMKNYNFIEYKQENKMLESAHLIMYMITAHQTISNGMKHRVLSPEFKTLFNITSPGNVNYNNVLVLDCAILDYNKFSMKLLHV